MFAFKSSALSLSSARGRSQLSRIANRRGAEIRARVSDVPRSRLTADERQVLGALILPPEAGISEKTLQRIAARTALPQTQVAETLRKLETLEPPLVHRDTDAKLNVEFWIALEPAIEEVEGADSD